MSQCGHFLFIKNPPIYSWVESSLSLFLFFFLLVTTTITMIAATSIAKKMNAIIAKISSTAKTIPTTIRTQEM